MLVSANAGSGKTHVLAQRVINLLLRGADPGKDPLHHLHQGRRRQHGDARFRHAGGMDRARRRRARRRKSALSTGKAPMPAQRAARAAAVCHALETPGGLKVQTIHAFCTRLLHQFPFEADVAARFDVLDEAATTQLLKTDARRDAGGRRRSGQRARPGAGHRDHRRRRHHLQGGDRRNDRQARPDHRVDRRAPAASSRRSTNCPAPSGLRPDDSIQAVENEYLSSLAASPERMAGADRSSSASSDKDRQGTCRAR